MDTSQFVFCWGRQVSMSLRTIENHLPRYLWYTGPTWVPSFVSGQFPLLRVKCQLKPRCLLRRLSKTRNLFTCCSVGFVEEVFQALRAPVGIVNADYLSLVRWLWLKCWIQRRWQNFVPTLRWRRERQGNVRDGSEEYCCWPVASW